MTIGVLRMSGQLAGHLVALATIIVWGVTFISTKLLLEDFSPLEILFLRFIIGWLALWLVSPHALAVASRKDELLFALAGISGISLYFIMENVALTLTYASNVGVIVAVAPFFTALLAWFFLKAPRPGFAFVAGFLAAIIGIACISFSGSQLALNPSGDGLALLAALAWAIYSILVRMLAARGYGSLLATRRIFFYGLVSLLPILPLADISLSSEALLHPANLTNLLFLGLCASALCFATWTFCVRRLGAVKASLYIYLVPVVTVATSIAVLDEQLTWLSGAGMGLTIAGLLISEWATPENRPQVQEPSASDAGQA